MRAVVIKLKRCWRIWQRIVRSGVTCNHRRYTLNQIVLAWSVALLTIYIINALLRAAPPGIAASRYKTNSSFKTDTHFWHGRHVIFCISPGRSGSKYLRNVLDVAQHTIARHEPQPKMNGEHLQRVILQGSRAHTFEERSRLKLAAMRTALEGTAPNVVYAETSHMFVKTFADVVLDGLGDCANISIVFLRRPARDTIWSQLRLGWFSPGHSGKNVWYYDINDVHESERQVSYSTNSSDAIDSLIGYNADVLQRGVELERLIQRKQRQGDWKNVQLIDMWLKDVSDAQNVKTFLPKLGLTADVKRLAHLKSMDTNARELKKDRFSSTATIEQVDARIAYMLNKLPLPRQAL